MAVAIPSIRQRVQAASSRIRRVKRLDRLATLVITLGGVFIIVAVSFIFVFIFGQAVPLFRPAQGEAKGVLGLAPLPGAGSDVPATPLAFGVDEYQMYLYELMPDARFVFYRTNGGTVAREVPVAGLEGATVSAASRSL